MIQGFDGFSRGVPLRWNRTPFPTNLVMLYNCRGSRKALIECFLRVKTWATTIKADLEPLSGLRYFGHARWTKGWAKASSELAQDRRAWGCLAWAAKPMRAATPGLGTSARYLSMNPPGRMPSQEEEHYLPIFILYVKILSNLVQTQSQMKCYPSYKIVAIDAIDTYLLPIPNLSLSRHGVTCVCACYRSYEIFSQVNMVCQEIYWARD